MVYALEGADGALEVVVMASWVDDVLDVLIVDVVVLVVKVDGVVDVIEVDVIVEDVIGVEVVVLVTDDFVV